MKKPAFNHETFQRTAILVTLVVLLTFGSILAALTFQVRDSIRQQITQRDAEALYPFAQLALKNATTLNFGAEYEDDSALLSVVLETSQLKNVFGVKLYDTNGFQIYAVPSSPDLSWLEDKDIKNATLLKRSSRFHPHASINHLLYGDEPATAQENTEPILEVILPLHAPDSPELKGIAQYFIDGQSIEAEFSALDRSLWAQTVAAFLAGGILLGIILVFSFRHLRGVNRLLEERSRRLAQANADLILSAKTSALGAVTAHLLHGLKNPLASLQMFVDTAKESPQEADWKSATHSTHRMREMINEMVTVIQEEQTNTAFDFTLDEIRECLFNKATPLCERANIQFTASPAPDLLIDSRKANLLLLILMNLIENAIQATRSGGKIRMNMSQTDKHAIFSISDTGPGIPNHVREQLFTPVESTKKGGSGVGLVISSQLAKHIGAELALEKSDSSGTCFSLMLNIQSVSTQSHTHNN